MGLINPFLYETVHLLIMLAFTFSFFMGIQRKRADALINRNKSNYLVFIYGLLFIIIVGFRPISDAFGDTVNYASTYESFSRIAEKINTSKDSLFYLFMWFCSQHMGVSWFFLIIEMVYVIPIAYGCIRLLKRNADIALIFSFAAFSFFTYGVNGIRNGISMSIVFLAITFINGNPFDKFVCVALSLLAVSLHASAFLPIACMLAASLIKKPNILFITWGLSILVSLIAGNTITNLFAGLGFDRLSDYILAEVDESLFSRVGFRWDFLLYSSAPVLLGWYLVKKKHIYNSTYLLLLGTYIFANAFWILIIRAEYSNRFAYLSWFLYPIVLAYPLLKLKIWPKSQGQKTGIIMVGHTVFTIIMAFFF